MAADERGSVVAVSLQNGMVDATYAYDEFGNPDAASAASGARFRYTGQMIVHEIGFDFYKARFCGAGQRRFLLQSWKVWHPSC